MTSFIGRESEVNGVLALFGAARMVTLLGPGGVGKTRIAVRAAASMASQFRDGIRMVELAGVRDGELLPHAVGAAFGLPEVPGRSPLDTVVEFLREEQSLLVLDTCEHLVDVCALFAEILLTSCPGLRLLLTSRQALDVPAEHTLTVAPLEQDEAVRLFVDRAAAARPGFALDGSNREQVAAVCRRLDGIPLALELAAVRLRALPLEQVLRRLEDRFRGLGGGRSTHPRHQTLRTAIDWSHDLCTPEERALWARLSVFAGGFDVDAAEQVCAETDAEAIDIVDHLIGLVDKSIVVRREGEGDDRYTMLDTIREYGGERLAASGESQVFARRHRDRCLRLAREGSAVWYGPAQVEWTHRFEREIDNFRTAMEWSLSVPGAEADGVAIAASLEGLWFGRGMVAEGIRWCDRMLAAGAGDPLDRARLRFQRATCTIIGGDPRGAVDEYIRAAEEHERLGDRTRWIMCLVHLGTAYLLAGDEENAQRINDLNGPLVAELANPLLLSRHFRNTGLLAARQGDSATGEALLLRGLEVSPPGEVWAASLTRSLLAIAQIMAGDVDSAQTTIQEALRNSSRLPDMFGVGNQTMVLGWVATAQGRFEEAAVLAGCAQSVRRGGVAHMAGDPKLLAMDAAFRRKAVEALGEREFARLRAVGEGMELRQALAFALGDPPVAADLVDAAVRTLAALTRREREVAALVHQGLSNREIAEKLVISKRTADAHVEHILAKLGFGSRGEIAALVRAENARAELSGGPT
ncbi:LuxR C-terminal-related transcriptional regulator [Streptomyces beijiangensis]